jgi:predicted RND superfamily exporter protein
MLIVASGFSLFLLSRFPPTQRLGALVCAGAVLTDIAVLVVLPVIATWRFREVRRRPPRSS